DIFELKMRFDGLIAGVNKHIAVFEEQVGAQQGVFRDLAAAQCAAWHDAAKQIHGAALGFGVERRADIERIAQQMEADASKTESQLQELMRTGKTSWSTLSNALDVSCIAFDRAVEAPGNAFKRTAERTPQS